MSERIQNIDHNEEIEYKGIKFRSKSELHMAETLDALGIPYAYESRKITLMDKFRCSYQKDMVRAITYQPDFMIGPIMIEMKGFETPEWKLKKKLLFKYLQENEPEIIFYQIHDYRKQLFEVLDNHWPYLGLQIKATRWRKGKQEESKVYDSVKEAVADLKIKGRITAIFKNLMNKATNTFGYNWELIPAYTNN